MNTLQPTIDTQLDHYWLECQQQIATYLNQVLPQSTQVLHQAMRYTVMNGGKRLRPLLVFITGRMFGVTNIMLNKIAASLELIHCYSLVHDDLPAMDDDDLRRGKPTCHKVYGDAVAILTGDALQTLAFEVLACGDGAIAADTQLEMIQTLARYAGANGMILGQALDMAAEGRSVDLDGLRQIHDCKTGALLQACIHLPLLAVKESITAEQYAALLQYGTYLGLAFQIQDDVLDVVSDEQTLGKPINSDIESQKATYVSILGLAGARQALRDTCVLAVRALAGYGTEADVLRALVDYIGQRADKS